MHLNKLRTTVGASVAGLALLLTAACGGGAAGVDGGGSNTLRVVLQAEPATLNPVFSVYSDSRAWGSIFDRLVGIDKQTFKPTDGGLLPSWEQTSPTEWTFDVRDGVTFHDGSSFDAAAAAFTIKEWRDNPESIWRSYYDVVKDAVVKDGKLVVTTTKPYAALPTVLTTAFAIPPAYYQKVGAKEFAQKPIGTGPFEFVSYKSGQSLEVKKNDKYWRGEPKLDGIDFTWNGVASSRYALLASGDADFAIDMQPQDVRAIKSSDKLQVVEGETVYGQTLFLNAVKDPMSDVRLREAVALSLNRQALVDSVFQGTGAVASSSFIGDLMHEPHQVSVPQDVERAKALVAEVGGHPKIIFGYTSGKFPNDARLGEAVAGMLTEVGFNVVQRAEEYGAYRDLRNEGAFDVFMQEIAPTFNHPDTFVKYFVSSSALLKSCVNAKKYDALNEDALAQPTIPDGDPMYAQIEEGVVGQDFCYAPLQKTVYSYGMSKRVQGFQAPRDASPDYFALSLK